ncbi:hypothetical protein PoB_005035600 [Plakobranchus ocellatus]|uniref:Uncharacterized protein n=1 Tax=Plakobranchus ocellatus TaxID=259542 RepID=A0AAV4BXK8_9GAST|nr:hypothetical protein PoB_005035600 [Plakobranchus ocellatus]
MERAQKTLVLFALLGVLPCLVNSLFFNPTIVGDSLKEMEILRKYPGLFKTSQEIKTYENALASSNINGFFFATYMNRKFHGCCATSTSFSPLTTAYDIGNNSVSLWQFSSKKQYVSEDFTSQLPGCYSCRCRKVDRWFSALVKGPNGRYSIELVRAPLDARCIRGYSN